MLEIRGVCFPNLPDPLMENGKDKDLGYVLALEVMACRLQIRSTELRRSRWWRKLPGTGTWV
jgi:hypothetical protein